LLLGLTRGSSFSIVGVVGGGDADGGDGGDGGGGGGGGVPEVSVRVPVKSNWQKISITDVSVCLTPLIEKVSPLIIPEKVPESVPSDLLDEIEPLTLPLVSTVPLKVRLTILPSPETTDPDPLKLVPD